MFNFITALPLTPHGFCLSWDPVLLGILIIGNVLTSISYIIIPLQIVTLVWGKKGFHIGFVNSNVIYLFALFILLCGVSHQFDIITLWLPYYWLQAAWMLLTGTVSLITAMSIPYLIEFKKGN